MLSRPARPRSSAARAHALAAGSCLACAALAAACSSARFRGGRVGGVSGRVGGVLVGAAGEGGRVVPGGVTVPGAAAGPDSSVFARGRDRRPLAAGGLDGVRRACRTGAWPRGWVAVAYEAAGGGCPGAAGDSAGGATRVAVLVRHDRSPLGTRLDVCADQPVPVRWAPAADEAPADPDACPGAARGGRAGVRRIVRVN